MTKVYLSIFVMAAITYLLRMVPIMFFRKTIENRVIRSALHYMPYAVLSSMTFPFILYSTGEMLSGALGLLTALILSFFGRGLLVSALAASLVAYLASFI